MTPAKGIFFCLAYILGLLITALPGRLLSLPSGGVGLLVLGLGIATLARKPTWRLRWPLRQLGFSTNTWLVAGLVAFCASVYWSVRLPQPGVDDISRWAAAPQTPKTEQIVTVHGTIASSPRLTRSQRVQFWLQATQLSEVTGQEQPTSGRQTVSGKVYVTVPLLQATGLRPGQAIAVVGSLYKPKPAANPGGFDFQAYLAQSGGFAGLSGRQVTFPEDDPVPRWSLWAMRQRILQAQVRWLGSPTGPLVSAMVLGNRVVDLPYDIRDQFVRVGLAHTLAASGFHVSLLLGVVLYLTRHLAVRAKVTFGMLALTLFVVLTGAQPSVLRAVVMGWAALLALATKRKVKPLNSLIIAATLLLLINPLWIWNIGFQLSFLATLGLLVTVSPLIQWLDWLPSAIAPLVAVPIAAYLWTLPLQLYAFGLVSPYSIGVNILVTPLVSVISLGGMLSALAALVWPLLGSVVAWLLWVPTDLLLKIVDYCNHLPGQAIAVGTISSPQVLILYGLLGLVWLQGWWKRHWWVAGLIALSLVMMPVWYVQNTLFRVTVLATAVEPVLVIQDRGQVALINSGNETRASLNVLPFLQQQGINRIDWAVTTTSQERSRGGWLQVLSQIPVKAFYDSSLPAGAFESDRAIALLSDQAIFNAVQRHRGIYHSLATEEAIQIGSTSVQKLKSEPTLWQFRVQDQRWLWLGNPSPSEQKALVEAKRLPPAQVLWWSGEALIPELLETVKPEVAIASTDFMEPQTLEEFEKRKIKLYWTERDGAIRWTPELGFQTTLESTDQSRFLL